MNSTVVVRIVESRRGAIYNPTGSLLVDHTSSLRRRVGRLVVQEDFEHREDAAASNVETQSNHLAG